jgi:hypothetical protein
MRREEEEETAYFLEANQERLFLFQLFDTF